MRDIRKLAHELLDEIDEQAIPEVINNMRSIKEREKDSFLNEEPSSEDIIAVRKARKDIENGEFFTHDEIFAEEDHVG